VLLTIEGKWLEAIMHMTKFEFLNFPRPKQVQLIISICIHGKFRLLTTSHSSDILSIRFKHTRILRFFGLFKKYLKILDTKANFQAFVFL
jgi:hypothetical protein